MRRIAYIFFLLSTIAAVSCRKNITDLNINPTRPTTVASGNLFSNASINLADRMASTNVNTNNFRLFVQYWTETIYRDETRYNLNQRSISDDWWAEFYRDIIKDLDEASKQVDKETELAAGEAANRKAINEILTVYSYYTLVTTFGDIPYTQALDIDNLQPQYDNAADVYAKISARLDAALTSLDPASPAYGSADLILNGDVDGWKRFGNSLKMRMGMLLADVDPATAQTMVLAAAPNVIASNDENIKMRYLASPPNTNPVWEDLVQSGRHDFVAAKPFVDTLLAYNDPRLPFYFNKDITTDSFYIGQKPGVGATFNRFSAPSSTLSQPEFPHTLFSYAEMEFFKAEAIERGFAVGGTAEEHYNNAIDASIEEWGGTADVAGNYRSQPSVKYTTAAGDYKEKIGVQSWIALYNRGYEAWTQWRRLDYPKLTVPTGALFSDGEVPAVITRMTYPVVEQNLNKGSYEKAASAVGKDQITQKLWFDKF